LGATCVDAKFASTLRRFPTDCYIMNGFRSGDLINSFESNPSSPVTATVVVNPDSEHPNLRAIMDYISSWYLDYSGGLDVSHPREDERSFRDIKREYLSQFLQDPSGWERRSCHSGASDENKFAYILSILLERLGSVVYSDQAIKRQYFQLLADQVLEDWLLVFDWVYSVRRQHQASGIVMPTKRRYAEWLALTAYKHFLRCLPECHLLSRYEALYTSRNAIETQFSRLCEELEGSRPNLDPLS
jgi:hypothetical protein